jgi:hypothetical protein
MESFIRSSNPAAIFTKQHLLKGLLMVITGVMLTACSPDQPATDDHGHSHGSGADHHAHGDDSHDHGEGTHTHDDAPATDAFYGDEAAATETSPAATSASAPDAHSHSSETHDHSHADDEHTHDHDH